MSLISLIDPTSGLQVATYNRAGYFGDGVVLTSGTDAIKYNGMYYVYTGTFPHTETEGIPTSAYRSVGLLNGWPITHTRNWGIVSDGTNETSKLQFMLANMLPDALITSDMRPISVAALQLTTAYPSVKFKGVRFAPYFAPGETVLPLWFNCNRSGLLFEDCSFTKPPLGSSITTVFQLTNVLNVSFVRCVYTGVAGTVGVFWKCFNVKESRWVDNRIELDSAGYTGDMWELNYSVNNTVSGGFYSHGRYLVNALNTSEPTFGYKSEGFYITGTQCVFWRKPLQCPWITALHAVNNMFDFCLELFYTFTNGGNSLLINNWFANYSTSTSSNFAQVAAGTYTGLTVTGNTFVNNTVDNTKVLFSHNPSSAYGTLVTNNRALGFSEGILLGAASQTYGNTYYNSGSTVGTNNSKMQVTGQGLELANKNTWAANANSAYLQFSNRFGSAYIRSQNGSLSDRIGISFSTLLGGVETQVMNFSDHTIRLPVLPSTQAAAGLNGLYATSDGIVRINR